MTAKKLLAKIVTALPLILGGSGAATGVVGLVIISTSRFVDGLVVGLLGLLLSVSGVVLARLGGVGRLVRRQADVSQAPRITAARTENDLVAALAAMRMDVAAHHEQIEARLRELSRDRSDVDEVLRQTAALLDLHTTLVPDQLTELPGGFAAEPATIHELVRHVLDWPTDPLVVECGSGSSTLWLALACRRRGSGRVVALEHDPHFAEETRTLLTHHRLEQFAEVRTAPLAAHPSVEAPSPWYAVEALSDLSGIDLLFVDGPPGHIGELARYPALPAFVDRLSAGAVVALDDAERPSEQAALEKWREEIGLDDLGLKGRTRYLRLSGPAPAQPPPG